MTAATAANSSCKPQSPDVALSICEPWAWLISAGFKTVENRTWSTKFRGTVAVHASTAKRFMSADIEQRLFDAHPKIAAALDDDRIGDKNPLFHFGCIVGTVDIVGCVQYPDPKHYDRDFDEVCAAAGFADWYAAQEIPPGVWASGDHCFLLANPVQFAEPIAAKGALNLWKMPADLRAKVAAVLVSGPHGSPVARKHKQLETAKAAERAKVAALKSRPAAVK